MLDLPAPCEEQFGAFTFAQAREHGMSRHQLQHQLAVRALLSLRRGVYVATGTYQAMAPTDQARSQAVAACLARRGSAVSHHSAVLVHDLPLIGSRPARPALTVARSVRQRGEHSREVSVRAAALPDNQVDPRGAWTVTSVARTVCDVAREQASVPALVAADAALNRGLTTVQELWAVAGGCVGWPGSQRLRGLLRLVDGGSESPYETVARWHLTRAGLPVVTQVWAYDAEGPIGCGDVWLPTRWAFLEVDGDVKYRTGAADTLLAEKQRQERLERAGFGVARVSAREARDARLVVARVEHAAAQGGYSRRASRGVTGYVGPPPPWALRGAHIPVARPLA